MNLTISQPSLAKALGIVSRAVSSRSTLPVLGNILLSAEDGQLRLAATNREIAITCYTAAQVEDIGATTIPARLLSEFVNSLPPEPINLELTTRTQSLRLSCARFNANIKGIDAFEFPLIPSWRESSNKETPVIGGDVYEVDGASLATAIESVIFAASQDEARPTLTGVEVTFDGKSMILAATDGYRMAMRTLDCTGENSEKSTMVIPAKSLAEVARVCKEASQDVIIVVSSKRNQVMFSAANEAYRVDIVSELIDARFPDYRATIPKNFSTRTIVDTAALLKAVRVALLFARDNANIIRVSVVPGNGENTGQIRLTASSAEMGDNVSEVDAEVSGDEIAISFNGRYILDLLEHMGQRAVIETTVSTRPGLFRPAGEEPYLALCMPMHPPR